MGGVFCVYSDMCSHVCDFTFERLCEHVHMEVKVGSKLTFCVFLHHFPLCFVWGSLLRNPDFAGSASLVSQFAQRAHLCLLVLALHVAATTVWLSDGV